VGRLHKDVCVGSVAYSGQPRLPGWMDVTLSLVVGWLVSAVAILVLYVAADLVGAISQPYGSHAGVVNEWPYFDNSLWALLANFAVILLALVLATFATSWWLRRKHSQVSDGRLAVVLLFTGWIPLTRAGPAGGVLGFLFALLLVRHWVARHEDRLAPRFAAILVAVLGAVVLSYGLLHPLWTTSVTPTVSAGKQRSVAIHLHNAARVSLSVDRIEAPGLPYRGPRPARLDLAPGADGTIRLIVLGTGCGTDVLGIDTRYHVFGLALSETVPALIRIGRAC
jgi:hypothetical protein